MNGAPDFKTLKPILKKSLRARGLNYKALAKKMSLSESGVKKIFASKDVSLARLTKICSIAGLSLGDLIGGASRTGIKEVRFTLEQEDYFVKNFDCFRVYWRLVYEQRSPQELRKLERLSEAQLFGHLRTLDRFKLLELLPRSKVRVPPSELVKWVGQGPLLLKIKREWSTRLVQLTASRELGPEQHFSLRHYHLTQESLDELLGRIRALDLEFAQRSLQELETQPARTKIVRMTSALSPGSYLDDERTR